jgi:hypothetical protein
MKRRGGDAKTPSFSFSAQQFHREENKEEVSNLFYNNLLNRETSATQSLNNLTSII